MVVELYRMKRSHPGFFTQNSILKRRSLLNMYWDIGYYWLRLGIYISLTLGTSAFIVSNTFSSTLYLLLILLIPGITSCYFAGLRPLCVLHVTAVGVHDAG